MRPRHLRLLIALLAGVTATSGMAQDRRAGPVDPPAAYLTVANPDEDDQLAAGDALTGAALSISRDGALLAGGAHFEDSTATGVNGNQADNGADNSGAAYVFARAGTAWRQQAYLKASNTQRNDQFGFAVALSGDGNTLAVTANFEDSAATGVNGNQADNSAEDSGAVYVFTRNGATWAQQAYIKSSNTGVEDRFGFSVALSDDGSTLAVGAINEDSVATGINGNQADNSAQASGAVYLFTRRGTAWSQDTYVKASNTQAGDLFGFCVTLSSDGNTLGVCGYDEDSSAQGINGDQASNAAAGSGAAYVFARSGGAWAQQAYVKASNTVLQSAFGSAIVLSGDGNTLVVCAVDEDGVAPGVGAAQWQADRSPETRTRIAEASAGAVYVYARTGGAWAFQSYIKSSNIQANDQFGLRLAISQDGNVLAAGAPLQGEESGAVYVFSRTAGKWSQQAYVEPAGSEAYDQFGSGVALSGNGRILAAGAAGDDGPGNKVRDAGSIYVVSLAAPEITAIASNAIRGPLLVLAADHQKQTGNGVAVQFDTSPSIARRLAAGESADVLITTPAGVDQAIKDGKALADSRVHIGKMAVGVAIKRGARRPTISSVDAVRAAIVQADAVLYSQGASGVYIEKMLRDMGLAEQVKGKAVQLPTGADMVKRLETSRGNEIGFTQVSELMEAEAHGGVTLVGPLPAALQNYTLFDAVVMTGARTPDAARAFVRTLTSPAGRKALASNGWEF